MTYNKKICLIGVFDFVGLATGGQPVKSRELYYALIDKCGEENLSYVETIGWKSHPLRLLSNIDRKSVV